MVRVSRIKRQVKKGLRSAGPDGLTPAKTLTAISKRAHELAEEQHLCLAEEQHLCFDHTSVLRTSSMRSYEPKNDLTNDVI